MSERVRKIAASMLLAVFALFVSADTLCLHTHVSDGAIVTHSHPYLPSAHHSHSGSQAVSIALVNALMFSDCGCGINITFGCLTHAVSLSAYALPSKPQSSRFREISRRGPPVNLFV